MIFQHSRFQIWNANQHPFRHTLDEFAYINSALPGISSVSGALDYITAVLYPQSLPAVATPAALPAVGNTINDMRVVTDDGDGKAASYRWEQREGEASASWHKIYDLDWGTDSILQGFLLKTQDIYVKQRGYDDLDASGVAVTGTLAGQSIYGGASANTNLTLFANSGDGVGAGTGYVQFGDNSRPVSHNTFDLGTTANRFKKIWSQEYQSGTLNLVGGAITDSSGSISFDNENLSTTGTVTSGSLVLGSGSITDSSGTINFSNENLTTTGVGTFNSVSATGSASAFAASTTIADFTFTNGNIASLSATVSFNALNITTTGEGTFGKVFVDNVRIQDNEIRATDVNGNLNLYADGTGKIRHHFDTDFVTADVAVSDANVTVTNGSLTVSGTGSLISVDNLNLNGNTISTTDANGNLILAPNGTGLSRFDSGVFPGTDSSFDIGKTGNVWNKLWIDGAIGGASEITITDLLTLRSAPYRDAGRTLPAQSGDALFYDGSQWLASAPDTEISHSGLSGLTTGDSGHTQFVMLTGRAGGQSVQGGTAASENLNLESTAHATKGFVQFKDTLRPFTDASYSGGWSGTDLGGSSNNLRHVYSKGEYFGLRFENVAVNPSANTQNRGRLVYNTADESCYVDTGTTFKKVGANRYETDTVWNGTDTTKNVTVSGVDATKAIWQLKSNTNDYEVMYVPIRATSTTNVFITLGTALPAGSYRLVGIE
jgi:hypothetical protein